MSDSILYLVEGAKKTSVECIPDRETDYLPGLVIPQTRECVNLAMPNRFERSFFHIVQDIIMHHDRFFRTKKRKRDDYFIYFGFHVTSEPMTWEECEEQLVATSLGIPTGVDAWDCYSDLTGYLWTSIEETGGHNVLNTLGQVEDNKFVSLKFSIDPKEG